MGLESGSSQSPRPVVALQGMLWAGSARVSFGSSAGVRGAVAVAYTTDATTCSVHIHISQGQNLGLLEAVSPTCALGPAQATPTYPV